MANTVFLVDNLTRLVLPDSQWAYQVRERLASKGHNLTATSQQPDRVMAERSEDEMARVDALLEETGL